MLTPEYLEALPEPILAVIQELEEWTIADVVRQLKDAGLAELAENNYWDIVYAYDRTQEEKKREQAKKKIDGLFVVLFGAALAKSFHSQAVGYAKCGKKAKYASVSGVIDNLSKQIREEIANLTGTLGFATIEGGKVVFNPTATYFQKTLNKAVTQIKSGAASYDSVIRAAINEMSNSGLRTVDYASGTTRSLYAATRTAVMTGVNKASVQMTETLMDELGAEYVEVTAHAGARPSHAEWQGKVYRMNGSEPDYPNLADETGYGTVTGLCGANCRHTFYPFFPGISKRAYTSKELRHIDAPPFEFEGRMYTAYEATQKQRQFERNIRATKDKLVGFDEAGLTDEFTAYSARLKSIERGYRNFSKAANLPTQNARTQAAGFGKSASQKAVWANRRKMIKKAQ